MKVRPGMKEISKNPLRRSTTPLDSGCGLQPDQGGGQGAGERADTGGVPLAACRGLAVLDQSARDRAELLQQLSHAQQKIGGTPDR